MSLSRFWQTAVDQLTPKASAHTGQAERNPFDSLSQASSSSSNLAAHQPRNPPPVPSSRHADLATPGPAPAHRSSSSSGPPAHLFLSNQSNPLQNGLVTPTAGGFSPNVHAAATTSVSKADPAPEFAFTADPSSRIKKSANGKGSPGTSTAGSSPAGSVTGKTPPKSDAGAGLAASSANRGQTHSRAPSTSTSTGGPRGRVNLLIVEARNLSPPSANAKPYVVVTSEQSEFVSREPEDQKASSPDPGRTRTGSTSEEAGAGKTTLVSDDAVPNINKAAGSNTAVVAKPEGDEEKQKHKETAENQLGSSSPAYNPVWKHEVIFDATAEEVEISASVYDRGESEECFMGFVTLKTRLSNNTKLDEWFKLLPRSDEHVTGEIRLQVRYERIEHAKRSLKVTDFDFLRLVGRGTFGRVFQVRKRDTKRIYAMKVLSKRDIVAKKEVAHTIGERKILQKSSECPFLLGLKFSFQTEKELFLVMDYKGGGELFHHLQREGRFGEERARFYAAEITLAFEHLHKYDIVYRDLKPENILLDAEGHVVLCDFGLSKPDLPSDALTNTFCGTTEYLAPEVLLDDQGYTKTIDFWSLGVLLYELIAGWSPFYSEDTQQMYKNICFGKIRFPRGVMSDPGKQFVKGLLNRNPKHRLGAERGTDELKEHAFFDPIDWTLLAKRQITPPFKPYLESDESTQNFDKAFTDADIWEEAPEEAAEEAYAEFAGFDNEGPEDEDYDEEDKSDAWLSEVHRAAQEQGRTGTGRAYSVVEPGMIPQLGDEPHSQNAGPTRPANALERGPSEDGGAGSRGADVRKAPKEKEGKGKTAPKPVRMRKKSDGEPLTSSIQAHFRGFSFHGEGLEEEGFASRYEKDRRDAPLAEAEREFES